MHATETPSPSPAPLLAAALAEASDAPALVIAGEPPPAAPPKPRMTLYDIGDWLLRIDGQLEEAEGELTPELEAQLTAAEGSRDEKVSAIVRRLREREKLQKAAKEEKERFAAIEKAETRAITWWKGYLYRFLTATNTTKAGTKLAGARLQANSTPTVTVAPTLANNAEAIAALPPALVTRIPEVPAVPARLAVDEAAVLRAWKAKELTDAQLADLGITVAVGQHVRLI